VKLTRSLPDSATATKTGVTGCPYSFSIEECQLFVKACTINKDLLKHHQELFSRGLKAQFQITTTQVRSTQIPTGCQTYLTEILWSGRLPIFAIFGLTKSTRLNGAVNKHPTNWALNYDYNYTIILIFKISYYNIVISY